MQTILEKKITQTFSPEFYQVINESDQHSGPATNSHFKVIIVSNTFTDMPLIKRHRLVNELFREELRQIHALAIHTYTKEEWQQKHKQAPKSPQCSNK